MVVVEEAIMQIRKNIAYRLAYETPYAVSFSTMRVIGREFPVFAG